MLTAAQSYAMFSLFEAQYSASHDKNSSKRTNNDEINDSAENVTHVRTLSSVPFVEIKKKLS